MHVNKPTTSNTHFGPPSVESTTESIDLNVVITDLLNDVMFVYSSRVAPSCFPGQLVRPFISFT
eukprot:8164514-Pyramimonas_sp.AAC.1